MKKYLILYIILFILSLACFIFANNQLALILAIVMFVVYLGMLLYINIVSKNLLVSYSVDTSCKTLEKMVIKTNLNNKSFLPLGKVECVFEFTNRLFKSAYSEVAVINYQHNVFDYNIIHLNPYCGKVSVVLKEVRVFDLLSLHYKTITVNTLANYFVYPPYYKLNVIVKDRLHKNVSGDNFFQNYKGNDSSEVFDLREYQKGDSLKSVHWKLSTKLDKLIIKEFSHPYSFHTMIMCDAIVDENHKKSVNTLLGTVISISDQFMKKKISHYIGYYDGSLKNIRVENKNDYILMIDTFLSTSLESNGHNNVDYFLNDDQYHGISEIIYVTNNVDEHIMELLSDRVNLTVIYIQNESFIEQRSGYQIISLNMDNVGNEHTNIIL